MLKKLLSLVTVVTIALAANAQDVKVVLDEDFAAFTEGSVDAPGTTDISGYTGKLATTLSGWSGRKIYEAGGALLVSAGGNLQTARYGMSTTEGNVRITLRLKAKADYGEAVTLALSYTDVAQFLIEGNEWTEVSVVTDRGSSSSYLKVTPMFEGVYVDRILVEQSKAFVVVPEPYQPTNANGTSFTASWKRVTGATAYLLNVYSKDSNGERNYFMQDAEYTTTSAKVEGLTDGVKYYFTVRTKVGENVSEESNEIEVIKSLTSLEAPVATAATNVSALGFTANWDASKDAESYVVNIYGRETLSQAKSITVIDEDFSGVKVGTLESVEFGKLSESLDAYTKTPGWWGTNHAFAAGYIGLAPFGSSAEIETPVMDLAGRKATITLNMAEYSWSYYTGGVVTVNVVDVATEEVVDSMDIEITAKAFADYTFSTEKGTEESYFQISYNGSKKLFIDNVTVAVDYVAGDTYTMHLASLNSESTSLDVNMTAQEGLKYFYDVVAEAQTVDSLGEITTITSVASNMVEVEGFTGVEAVETQATVTSQNGAIVIAAQGMATIYNAAGSLVATAVVDGESRVDVAPGVYVVNAAGSVSKVVVK